jgi:hypothetical protein
VATAGAGLLAAAGLVPGATPAGAAVTGKVSVSATPVPGNLVPTKAYSSTASATNTGTTTSPATSVTISLPAPASGAPTVTFVPRRGLLCSGLTTKPLCQVPRLAAKATVVVGTLTGTPRGTTGPSGVSTSARVSDSVNSVTVTWRWLPTLPNLTGTLHLSPDSMYLGQYVTGTLTIGNVGYAAAGAFETVVPIVRPYTAETLVSQTIGTSCIPYYTELDCYTTSLAPSAAVKVLFTYEPNTGPSLTLTGTVDAYNQVTQITRAGDALASNTVLAGTGANLNVVATNVASTPQGSNLVRTITVANSGNTPAYTVVIQDWSGWFPLVPTGSPSTCAPFYTAVGKGVKVLAGTRCTLGEIPPMTSASVSFSLEVKPTQVAGTYTNALKALTTTPQSPSPGATASVVVTVPTGPVGPALLVPPGAPSGYAVVGDVMTASTGGWNGTAPFTYSFRWVRCNTSGSNCAVISNATGSTQIPQASEIGSTIEAQVTASNGGGSATAVSAPTVAVIAASAPLDSYVPVITPLGEPAVGVTYDASAGSWTGTPVISYGYQWLRCDGSGTNCQALAGATGASYVLTAADLNASLEVEVTATNSGGSQTAISLPASTAD